MVSCLLPAAAAEGGDGRKTRDVSIRGTGLVLRVAQEVAVWPEKPADPDGARLWVTVETIQSFRDNGIVGVADVLDQRAALAKGEPVVAENWEEDGLSEVVSLPIGGYAVMYPWYSQFEYCALEFTMNAAFFVGNRRVTLRYGVSPAVIIRENPSYFRNDGVELGCDTGTIWNHAEEEDVFQRFQAALKAGRLGPAATAWYADFTGILASLRLASVGRKTATASQRR